MIVVVLFGTLAAAALVRIVVEVFAPGFFPKANRFHVTADMTYQERRDFWAEFTPDEQKRAAEQGIY